MAYSQDLRWRIMFLKYGHNRSPQNIARYLNVSLSTVFRIIRQFRRTGDVLSLRKNGRPAISRLLTRAQMLILCEFVLRNGTAYFRELSDHLEETTGSRYSAQSLCRLLKRCGYSRKRIHRVALQKRIELTEEYRRDTSVFRPEELIFVDETFCDRRISRNYGYSPVGQRATGSYANPHGPRLTVIAAISYQGLSGLKISKKRFDARKFRAFIRNDLVPILQPYNGVNSNSVVVMDNHAAHHVREIRQMIENAGALLFYLPPYSPELNPIEDVFANVKQWLRENDQMLMITDDPSYLVFRAFLEIDREAVKAMYRHGGY